MHPRGVSALSSLLLSLVAALGLAAAAAAAPPFTATEMMKLKRLADPQLSPDGTRVAYVLTEIDLAGGVRNADLWLAPRRGWRAAPADVEPGLGHAAALQPRRPRARLPLEPRRLVAGVAARAGRRRAAQAHARSRPASRRSSGWAAPPRAREPRSSPPAAPTTRATRRRSAKPASPPRRASTTSCSTATGTHGTTAAAATCSRSRWTDGRAARPDAGRRRRARPSTWAARRTARSRPGRPGGVRRAARTRRARRSPRTPSSTWCPPPAAPLKIVSDSPGYDSGRRYSPDGRWLAYRSQPRAGYEADRWRLDGLRPDERRPAHADRGLRPLGRRRGVLGRLEDDLLHRRGRRHATGVLGARGGRAGHDGPRGAGHDRGPGASRATDARSSRRSASLTHPAEIVRFGVDGKRRSRASRARTTRSCSRLRARGPARASATPAPRGRACRPGS